MKQIRFLGFLCPTILILAMAFGATNAAASRLVSSEVSGETTTFLKATPSGSHTFTASGPGEFSCAASGFLSSMTKTQVVSQFSTEGLGEYACTLFGSGTTMKMNGCSLTFHPGAEKSAGVFGGTVDIGPVGCGPITMKYLGSCELKIYPKTGLGAEFVNKGSGKTASVEVKVAATGLKTESPGCGSTAENGTYTGSWELTGSTDVVGNTRTGISVTGKAALYLGGEPTKFTGEAYPEGVLGSVSAAHTFSSLPGGTVSCKKGSFLSSLTAASTQLTLLAPTYSECVAFGFPETTVKNNGCSIVLNATGASSGTASISCPTGKAITVEPKFLGSTVCTLYLPAQSLGSVTYESAGTGIDRRILATISGSGIQSTGTGSSCGTSGSSGTFSGGIELQGAL